MTQDTPAYIVTGGAGFIGSRLTQRLCAMGADVIVVDDLTNGHKVSNLAASPIVDYFDKRQFFDLMQGQTSGQALGQKISGIFHQGACSQTTQWDGQMVMRTNFDYSKLVLSYCTAQSVPLVYASSAAVYGLSTDFKESPANELPLNPYGFSKLMFDRYVTRYVAPTAHVVGLRYFNVYGPGEAHKQDMASVFWHFFQQLTATGRVKLFEGSGGYERGEQRRDFVFVEDVVDVNLWAMENTLSRSIMNVGTGKAQTFNDVAEQIIKHVGRGSIDYIPFPEKLKGAYQHATCADLTQLRQLGCKLEFSSLEQGAQQYVKSLQSMHQPPS